MGGADIFEFFLMGNMNVKEQFTPSHHTHAYLYLSDMSMELVSLFTIFSIINPPGRRLVVSTKDVGV